MRVLYFSQWPLNEGLTQATVIPSLKLLLQECPIEQLIFSSLEAKRQAGCKSPITHARFIYQPIRIGHSKGRLISKWMEYTSAPRLLKHIYQRYGCDCVIARGATAGSILYRLHQKIHCLYVVESFEPHADYMKETGLWKPYSMTYKLQKYWENRQIQTAHTLITVSHAYRHKLITSGRRARHSVATAPCPVDMKKFAFSLKTRTQLRQQLHIEEADMVGIYVGKFSGMYVSIHVAAKLFATAARVFKRFKLIILTPTDPHTVRLTLLARSLEKKHITWIGTTPHESVPSYLSAADFAFSLHWPSPSKRFVSPIKNAEYWANGLPVAAPTNVGDDADWIQQNPKTGALFNVSSIRDTAPFAHIESLMARRQSLVEERKGLRSFVSKHRGIAHTQLAYQKLFAQLKDARLPTTQNINRPCVA